MLQELVFGLGGLLHTCSATVKWGGGVVALTAFFQRLNFRRPWWIPPRTGFRRSGQNLFTAGRVWEAVTEMPDLANGRERYPPSEHGNAR